MEHLDEIVFECLDLIVIPVRVAGRLYVLREADGAAASKYQNAMAASTRFGPDGKVSGYANIGELEPFLVSLCLFEATENDGQFVIGNPVDRSVIDQWPSKYISRLYDRAKQISELGEADVENPTRDGELTDTGDGSN